MSVARRKRNARALLARGIKVALCGLTLATPAWAQLPEYTLQLQARTNLRGNASGAYNVAPGNLLAGSLQVPLAGNGQLAFRLAITPEGRSAVWWGQNGVGRRIYQLPDLGVDARMSDPGVNSRGDIAFAVTGATSAAQNGIYLLNVDTPDDVRIIRVPVGASDWSSLWLNEAGQIGFRATFAGVGRAYAVASETPGGAFQATIVASERAVDGVGPYEFLYSPTMNDLGQMAGVGDLATASSEYFQELRIFEPDGQSSRLIARTRGLDAASQVYRFASVQPALNNLGQVAFLGTARNAQGSNVTTLWLWDGNALRVVAQDGQGDIRQLEFFPPDISDNGVVVFRAFDSASMRAVWVGDGQGLRRVVTEHDLVLSDLGPARIDQETPSNPVFAGSAGINVFGEVTLAAGLAPPDNDQEEWGTAVFVARPTYPDTDGGVDGGPGPDLDGGPGPDLDGGPGPDLDGGPGPDLDGGVDGGPGPDLDGGVDGGPGPDLDGGPGEDPDGGVDGGPGEDPDAGPGTDPDAGPDAGPGTDPDAGPGEEPGADGGPGEEPGTDAGQGQDAGTSPPPPPPDSGCGCQSSSPTAMLPWMLVGLMRVVVGRRRKAE
ncbi:MXAN_5453 family MXYO-CTERM-anchored protein [Myxococcus sp. Y35]|uniref:MXAN_5453 family MXYO-CTERM-anchored protein n=1 Tax=Pseudomyxococcus flavus TaxID=3115648 RepID=UPI003CF355C6